MPSGTLGTPKSLAITTYFPLYGVPANKVATANINLVNTAATVAKVRIAIGTANPPNADDWLEYDAILQPAGDPSNGNVLERTSIAMEAGKTVFVWSSIAGVVARAHGFES